MWRAAFESQASEAANLGQVGIGAFERSIRSDRIEERLLPSSSEDDARDVPRADRGDGCRRVRIEGSLAAPQAPYLRRGRGRNGEQSTEHDRGCWNASTLKHGHSFGAALSNQRKRRPCSCLGHDPHPLLGRPPIPVESGERRERRLCAPYRSWRLPSARWMGQTRKGARASPWTWSARANASAQGTNVRFCSRWRSCTRSTLHSSSS